jgi:hypothetical protein
MNIEMSPADLKKEFEKGSMPEDDYIEQIVRNIGFTHDVNQFLECVYENFYDRDTLISPVSAFTDLQLLEAFNHLEDDCSLRHDFIVKEYIGLLKEMLPSPQAGVMVRWALAKLVGMAVARVN